MLPIMLRITLGVGLVLYFTVILLFLKYKAIELKYTLIWIFLRGCHASYGYFS